MGIYSTAKLIYGVPVSTEDSTELWDPNMYGDDEGDWKELSDPLIIVPYGHYEDYENRAIVSSKAFAFFGGDCWDPTKVGKWDFNIEDYQPEDYDVFVEALAELDDSLPEHRGWYLVASVG